MAFMFPGDITEDSPQTDSNEASDRIMRLFDQKRMLSRKLLYQSDRTVIYLGTFEEEKISIVLKSLCQEPPDIENIVQLSNEYELTCQPPHDSIRKSFGKLEIDNRQTIVMEYIEGESLRTVMIKKRKLIPDVLKTAIQLADILDAYHQRNIVHRHLTPDNILIESATGQIKVIDFGQAARSELKVRHVVTSGLLKKSLAYTSPEQTGRMNRAIDYRADFYSLGVILYEMLSGHTPFASNDFLELIHCHIAKKPQPLNKLNPDISPFLSAVVDKLLAKNAEDRYQSAFGILSDLKLSLKVQQKPTETTLTQTGHTIGSNDFSNQFTIPQKLYGRETDITFLMRGFDQVIENKTPGMLLVAGFSGVGKTSLVHEIHKPIVRKKGNFIEGKFDQLQYNVPYFAFIQAFDQILSVLLIKSDSDFKRWKRKLLIALGNNGQVLIDVIPKLELIIGPQPEVAKVGPHESQNRFNMVVLGFLSVIAEPEHPLVIFLDDLQWADPASLNLIKLILASNDLKNLLLIGAYRDNEVDTTHPLMNALNSLTSSNGLLTTIKVQNLSRDHIQLLISETLRDDHSNISDLSQFVLEKSEGNPFLIKQCLDTIHDMALITFDTNTRQWQWNMEEIRHSKEKDTPAEMTKQQVEILSPDAREVLQLAACIGNQFNLKFLSLVLEKSPVDILDMISEAISKDYIFPIGRDQSNFRFSHDRIQQASYALNSPDELEAHHLKIGNLLLTHTANQEMEEQIFEIVHHLNIGRHLISSEREQLRLAELNLRAGNKAKASTAYETAILLFQQGISLLPDDSWDIEYQLTYSLFLNYSEAAFLNINYQLAEEQFEILLLHTNTILDKTAVHQIEVECYITQGKFHEAIAVTKSCLELLDEPLAPSQDHPSHINDKEEIKTYLNHNEVKSLLKLPPMKDAKKLATIHFLSQTLGAIFIVEPQSYIIVLSKLLCLSINYGNSPNSASAFVTYGSYIETIHQEIQKGNEFMELSQKLIDQYPVQPVHGLVYFCLGGGLYSGMHLKETLEYYLTAMDYCKQTGALQWLGYCYSYYLFTLFLSGEDLKKVRKIANHYREKISNLQQASASSWFSIWDQTIRNLLGETEDPEKIKGKSFDEYQEVPEYHKINDVLGMGHYAANKLFFCYLFGNYNKGLEIADRYHDIVINLAGNFHTYVFCFYEVLVLAALFENMTDDKKEAALQRIIKEKSRFEKYKTHCPENYLQKYLLMKAEYLRITEPENHIEIMKTYDEAIESAQKFGFQQEAAVANECAARFYFSKKLNKIGNTYLEEAYKTYKHWGAVSITNHLEKNYPNLR